LPRFLHVGEYMPLDPEHPTQAAVTLGVGAFAGAALAGAIDRIATARPATKSDTAFMAISSRFSGQLLPPLAEPAMRDFMNVAPACCEAVKPELKFEIRTLAPSNQDKGSHIRTGELRPPHSMGRF
jgi:hypothetical protein